MEEAEGLQIITDFCGADEAITNMTTDTEAVELVATLIVKAKNLDDAKKKMEKVIQRIMDEYGLDKYSNVAPNKEGN